MDLPGWTKARKLKLAKSCLPWKNWKWQFLLWLFGLGNSYYSVTKLCCLHRSPASGLVLSLYSAFIWKHISSPCDYGYYLGKELSLLYRITSLCQEAKGKHYSSFICLKSYIFCSFPFCYDEVLCFISVGVDSCGISNEKPACVSVAEEKENYGFLCISIPLNKRNPFTSMLMSTLRNQLRN